MVENQMSFLLFYAVSSIPLVSYIFTKKKSISMQISKHHLCSEHIRY